MQSINYDGEKTQQKQKMKINSWLYNYLKVYERNELMNLGI